MCCAACCVKALHSLATRISVLAYIHVFIHQYRRLLLLFVSVHFTHYTHTHLCNSRFGRKNNHVFHLHHTLRVRVALWSERIISHDFIYSSSTKQRAGTFPEETSWSASSVLAADWTQTAEKQSAEVRFSASQHRQGVRPRRKRQDGLPANVISSLSEIEKDIDMPKSRKHWLSVLW